MTPVPTSSLRLRFEPSPSVRKTEATVLRIHPFSHTSHVVVWLTEDGLRLATPVKGATRPKSPFLGQYDLFYTCELLYYARNRDGLHVARECEPLRRRDGLRTNWRAERCASWFAALADLVSDAGTPVPGLFRLLDETLDVLDALPGAPSPALFARFEAKLLAEAGLRPNFDPCPECGPDAAPRRAARFHLADGRLLCPLHGAQAQDEPLAPVVRLPRAAIDLYAQLEGSPSIGTESGFARSAPPATGALLRFLGLFLHYHLPDAPLAGRAVALEGVLAPERPSAIG